MRHVKIYRTIVSFSKITELKNSEFYMSLLIAPFWKLLLPASIRRGAFHSATQLSELFSVAFSVVYPLRIIYFQETKIPKTIFGDFRIRTASSFRQLLSTQKLFHFSLSFNFHISLNTSFVSSRSKKFRSHFSPRFIPSHSRYSLCSGCLGLFTASTIL